MKQDVLDRIVALLEEAGFKNVDRQESAHAANVSAERGDLRAVFHLRDRDEPPGRAMLSDQAPPPERIRQRAAFPSVEGIQPARRAIPSGGGNATPEPPAPTGRRPPRPERPKSAE